MASSSASPLLVIASGSSVVTWDCRNQATTFSEPPGDDSLRTFLPFASPDGGDQSINNQAPRIADLAWNHNGQVMACCSDAISLEDPVRKNIVLMSSSNGSMLDSFRHTDSTSDPTKSLTNKVFAKIGANGVGTGAASTCVAFGGKSRYLCIGDQQGDVCLWDLKKQSRVRQFKPKKRQPCLQACLDPTATYVCALSSENFTLYHLRQATFAKQWTFGSHNNSTNSASSTGAGGWNQFRFSPLQPTLIAFGDSTGRIQLHDGLDYEKPQLVCGGGYTTNTTTASSLLPHHASPITGLAFSTQNSKLLANVRGNGILEFVDTSTGEVIHHQQTGGGRATSLAFQGVSCVVGTDTGEVQVYDLRRMMQQFGKAVTTYKMPHGGAISTLEFAPVPKSGGSNHSVRTTGTARSRSPPSRRPSNSGSSLVYGNSISFDLESRASATSYMEPPLLPNPSSLLTTNTETTIRQQELDDRKPAAQDPVASSAEPKSVVASATPTTTTSTIYSQKSTAISSVAAVQSNNTAATPGLAGTQPQHLHQFKDAVPRQVPVIACVNNGVSNSTASQLPGPHQTGTLNNTGSASHTMSSSNRNNATTTPNTTSASSKGPSPEVTAYLQNMVRQELQHHVFGLREDLEGSIRNLHVDMIRQFHRQSKELTTLVRQQQQQIEQLLQQNEFLREQNASLLAQNNPSIVPGKNGLK